MNGGHLPSTSVPLRHGGFTLIELMVTVAIVAILAMAAAPSMRDFVIRNRSSAASNEFMGSVLRARNEAASRNSCVTMCVSSDGASCVGAAETAWNKGWIVYSNPACDASVVNPAATDVLLTTSALNTDYTVTGPGGLIFFSATGRPRSTDVGAFNVRYQTSTRSSNRTICVSPLGRTLTVTYGATCP